MMTREEVLLIEDYCAEHKISHKKRLEELGIPFWNFYKAKQKSTVGKMSGKHNRDSLFSFHPSDMSHRQCLPHVLQASPASQSNRPRRKVGTI